MLLATCDPTCKISPVARWKAAEIAAGANNVYTFLYIFFVGVFCEGKNFQIGEQPSRAFAEGISF